MAMDRFKEANRHNWDDRVPIHVASDEYAFARFVEDPSHISDVVAFDAGTIGDVAGKRLLHLQCHFGKDTLSWARLGAEVGVDTPVCGTLYAALLPSELGARGELPATD